MTVQEYRENTSLKDQKVFARKLQVWLGMYTQEVYVHVMKQMEDIINNTFALDLIDQLYERTLKEIEEEVTTIEFSLRHDSDLEYHLHNHPLTHSRSYRDILYDMYINDRHQEEP